MIEFFEFSCPTALHWINTIQTQRARLLNPKPQMSLLLERVREDVYSQFDEKQNEWKPLSSYTVSKKEGMKADPRILHESTTGLRLRDAYLEAGEVTEDGKLIYSYPVEKPYAVEHQMGTTDANIDADRPKKKKKRRKTAAERAADRLDDEYFDRFG